MATEIERKFLVQGEDWRTSDPVLIIQGYLHRSPTHTIRVRVAGSKACLAIKTRPQGITRQEFEYPIPIEEAQALLKLALNPPVEKRRHIVSCGGHKWEIDEFLGANKGLVVAEIELETENTAFEKPSWVGSEVTHDPRYLNSNLSAKPYTTW